MVQPLPVGFAEQLLQFLGPVAHGIENTATHAHFVDLPRDIRFLPRHEQGAKHGGRIILRRTLKEMHDYGGV